MQVEAILPDGSTQIVSYVGNFNFNWMTNYIYDDDAAPLLPKGTIIHVSAWYDNTKANKNNPDPDQWVGYGDRTVDEMAHAWMNVVYFNDDEYKALVAERKAKTAKTTERAPAVNRVSMIVCRRRTRRRHSCCLASKFPSRARHSAPASPAPSKAGIYNPDGSRSFSRRLLQPQLAAGARRPDRSEQPHRAGRPRPGAADAFPARPPLGHVHRPGAEGLQANRHVHLDDRRQRPEHEHSAAPAPRLRRQPVHRDRGRQHAAGDSRSSRARRRSRDRSRPSRRRSPAPRPSAAPLALPLWATDDAKYTSGTNAPLRNPPPAGAAHLVEVSRPRHGHLRQAEAGGREAAVWRAPFSGKATTTAKFSEAGRLRAARHRQRLLRRRRRRLRSAAGRPR